MTPPIEPSAERHAHVARPRGPGRVRVDMHAHTMWSGDCTTTPDELVAALADQPVDVVCVTDHNTVNGGLALAGDLPVRVVVGEELRTGAGEIIGLFLTERVPMGVSAREAALRIRDQGGLVYVPHPFDPMRSNLREHELHGLLEEGLVDCLEVFNAKTQLQHLNQRAAEVAAGYGVPGGAGSDAHVPEAFGAAYVEMPDFHDAASFLAGLAEGEVVGHHFDAPRRWRPRIVPSTKSL